MSALITYLIESGWWGVIEVTIQIGAVVLLGLASGLIVQHYKCTRDWREP